jgi:pimeloyl-ACP methyl ester carboxylesterase
MPELTRHYQVVAVELPGLGESDFPRDGYETGSISLHFDAVLDAFGARDCIMVTHDVGAWVGYAYAACRPQRVKHLVLIDAAIPGLASPEAYRLLPETAGRVWHFYFNYIPELPELLVVGREREFLAWLFHSKSADCDTAFDRESLDLCVKAYSAPPLERRHGLLPLHFDSIEQNRATASTPLTMPVLAVGVSASYRRAVAVPLGFSSLFTKLQSSSDSLCYCKISQVRAAPEHERRASTGLAGAAQLDADSARRALSTLRRDRPLDARRGWSELRADRGGGRSSFRISSWSE